MGSAILENWTFLAPSCDTKMYRILYTTDAGGMMRAKDIRSLTEHRAHLTENCQHVKETGRPLFVTANGRAAAVVLSPDAYDALARKDIRSIAAKHGLKLNR